MYTCLLAALFYLEYGLYFSCGLYVQHAQRDKVFAWANRFSGQMFTTTPMTQMKKMKMKMTPTTIYRTCRRISFFWRRRFHRFWTIKLTFITFACKIQYFVIDWSRRVFTGEKVNWPVAFSWIILDSRYMAKIFAAAYLQMQLISEYIRYLLVLEFPTQTTW